MTGKSSLTYSEAVESEENARKLLTAFSNELRQPILYLGNRTQRTTFADMAEDVFLYMRDRYFNGENVEALFDDNKWHESHILQVVAPEEEEIKKANGLVVNNITIVEADLGVGKLDVGEITWNVCTTTITNKIIFKVNFFIMIE